MVIMYDVWCMMYGDHDDHVLDDHDHVVDTHQHFLFFFPLSLTPLLFHS